MDPISLMDRVPVSGLRRDSAGNLVGVARAARTGIQIYSGFEVGRPDMRQVRVYRPEEEVFSRGTMASFAAVPVTIDHPPVLIDTENWKDYAKGETASDDIVRDGEVIRVPFIIRDAGAIKAAEDQKHEVSMGYQSKLDFTAGQTPDGEAYDAVMRCLRMNHLAIVDKARGGPQLRIGDSEPKREPAVKTILIDGFQVEVTDQAEAAIVKLQANIQTLTDSNTKLGADLTAANTAKSEADGKIVVLEKQLQDATDPAALQAAAASRASLIALATKVVPGIVTDGKTDDEIRKAVVDAKMGASAEVLDEAGIAGAFAALTAGVKTDPPPKTTGVKDAVSEAITSGTISDGDEMTTLVANRDAAMKARMDRLHGVKPEAK